MLEINIKGILLRLLKGDITEQNVDAIVNAANSSLMGGGGVDGAIHRKGGPIILKECKQIRSSVWPEGLSTGKVVITSGGNLKARFVIHTVGPIWHGGKSGEKELLKDAYLNSLKLAVQKKLKSISGRLLKQMKTYSNKCLKNPIPIIIPKYRTHTIP